MSGAPDRSRAQTGAVLAGGRATRFGGAKASVPLAGRPLASYPLAAMRDAGLDALLVAKRDSDLPDLGCRVLHEPPQPRHPLCGILAALRESDGGAVVVCPCDMPFVPASLLAWLGELDAPFAVVSSGERLHPLLGRYESSLAEALEEQLRRQASLTSTVSLLGARVIGEREIAEFGAPERICWNVNTRADLEHAEALLATRKSGPHPCSSSNRAR